MKEVIIEIAEAYLHPEQIELTKEDMNYAVVEVEDNTSILKALFAQHEDAQRFAFPSMYPTPRYEHDECIGCRYMGQYEEYDLYFCRIKHQDFKDSVTIMARFGPNGDYYTNPVDTKTLSIFINEINIRAMFAAEQRAIALGFVTHDELWAKYSI